MNIELTTEELTLIVFALRPKAFDKESAGLSKRASKLQKELIDKVREREV